jgi:hypothetical protein
MGTETRISLARSESFSASFVHDVDQICAGGSDDNVALKEFRMHDTDGHSSQQAQKTVDSDAPRPHSQIGKRGISSNPHIREHTRVQMHIEEMTGGRKALLAKG